MRAPRPVAMETFELREIVAGAMWAFERPVWFSGVRLRARTTVLRLEDGSLLLHSPSPIDDALARQLRELGPVRWLVVPNCFHHLGAPEAASRCPEARVVGPASARARNAALRIDVDIGDQRFAEMVPELEALPLHGVPFLDETVLYHRPTQTLLGADLVLRARPSDHWTWRWAARITGCYDELRVPPDVRGKLVDRAAIARSIQAMVERPAHRLVVGHADIVEDRCRELLARAWEREGVRA